MRDPSSPWRRIGVAASSFLVAWLATGVVWTLWTRPWVVSPGSGTGWDDTLAFLLLEAGFAAIGWLLVVLPLVRLGNHEGRFFDPRTAPLVGAACGLAILLAEYALFFHLPPWEVLIVTDDQGLAVQLVMAALFGAVLWWTYTRRKGGD